MQETSCFNMSVFNLKEILNFFAFFVMCRMHKCRKRMDAQARPVKRL